MASRSPRDSRGGRSPKAAHRLREESESHRCEAALLSRETELEGVPRGRLAGARGPSPVSRDVREAVRRRVEVIAWC